MAIPSRQIGWGTEDNLLWQISKQLERLTQVTGNAVATTTSTTTLPVYKVFTALLTQSGGNDQQIISSGPVTEGVTYFIDGADGTDDFSNVGGPAAGTGNTTYFIAINNNVPNSYGDADLIYNNGAPVVTVLENTIGNIWFTYLGVGTYAVNSSELLPINKSWLVAGSLVECCSTDWAGKIIFNTTSDYEQKLYTLDSSNALIDNQLYETSIEIRVYN